jgi:hypothetical protein
VLTPFVAQRLVGKPAGEEVFELSLEVLQVSLALASQAASPALALVLALHVPILLNDRTKEVFR